MVGRIKEIRRGELDRFGVVLTCKPADLADADRQWESKRLDLTDTYNDREQFFSTAGMPVVAVCS